MKKIILILVVLSVTFACQKEEHIAPVQTEQTVKPDKKPTTPATEKAWYTHPVWNSSSVPYANKTYTTNVVAGKRISYGFWHNGAPGSGMVTLVSNNSGFGSPINLNPGQHYTGNFVTTLNSVSFTVSRSLTSAQTALYVQSEY